MKYFAIDTNNGNRYNIKYKYDANGIRTSKTRNGVTYNYIYEGNSLVAEQRTNGTETDWLYYLYGVDGVVGFRYNGTTYLYRKNLQGDVTHIYTVDGEQVGHYVYDAWGNMQILQDRDGIATLNPFRYRSYYFDEETGLYYLLTRYYDPEVGRFINADALEYLDPETIGGLNLYAYCGNNPMMAVDSEGTAWWHWLIAALVVVACVALTCVTAGGFGAGMMAIGMAANGLAFGSMATTVFAFASVGAGCAFAASAIIAGGRAIGTAIGGGSFTDCFNSAMNYGGEALGNTVGNTVGGIIGGLIAYKQQIGNPSQNGFMNKSDRDKQRYHFWRSQALDPDSSFYGNDWALKGKAVNGLQISHIYGTFGNNRHCFILQTAEEHKAFHQAHGGFKTAGGPFNRIDPNNFNWWKFLRALMGWQ